MKVISPILPKLVAMATSIEESKKLVRIDNIHTNTFHLVKKIVKIGPVESCDSFAEFKKKEITEGKIYSPVGKFAAWAKKVSSLNVNINLIKSLVRRCIYINYKS